MKKIFLTGTTGFIGRRLLNSLIMNSFNTVALVRRENYKLPQSNYLKIVKGELFDIEFLARSMDGCDTVYHLAACIDFNPLNRDYIYKVNIEGTEAVLKAAKKAGLKKMVFVSSACTAGISQKSNIILDEETPFDSELLKHNVYLASKKQAEDLVISLSDGNLQVVIANPTTVYGPGDYSLNSGSIIRTIVKSKIMPVFPGGTSVVDVDDIVKALILLGKKDRPKYNKYILTSENLLFKELFLIISQAINMRRLFIGIPGCFRLPAKFFTYILSNMLKFIGIKSVLFTPQIIEDTFFYKYYSADRAKSELGWVPEYTFIDSVERAWNFYMDEGLI